MKLQSYVIFGLLTTGLLLGNANTAKAQLTGTNADEFQQIEQPLALNVGITAAGIGLMGLELWWFMFSHPKRQAEETLMQVTEKEMTASLAPAIIPAPMPKMSVAVNLRAFYSGIEMGYGVLIVEEHQRGPKFSPNFA